MKHQKVFDLQPSSAVFQWEGPKMNFSISKRGIFHEYEKFGNPKFIWNHFCFYQLKSHRSERKMYHKLYLNLNSKLNSQIPEISCESGKACLTKARAGKDPENRR